LKPHHNCILEVISDKPRYFWCCSTFIWGETHYTFIEVSKKVKLKSIEYKILITSDYKLPIVVIYQKDILVDKIKENKVKIIDSWKSYIDEKQYLQILRKELGFVS